MHEEDISTIQIDLVLNGTCSCIGFDSKNSFCIASGVSYIQISMLFYQIIYSQKSTKRLIIKMFVWNIN